jgi:signal transduction histidine kinase
LSHPVLLASMLRNLVRNAIDYTPPGGQVFVAHRRYGSELRIEVRDTGTGIRANALATIFDAFQRADESRADGLGLGLFIVKRAADLLGHRVEVQSAEGQGSRFTVVARAIETERQTPPDRQQSFDRLDRPFRQALPREASYRTRRIQEAANRPSLAAVG